MNVSLHHSYLSFLPSCWVWCDAKWAWQLPKWVVLHPLMLLGPVSQLEPCRSNRKPCIQLILLYYIFTIIIQYIIYPSLLTNRTFLLARALSVEHYAWTTLAQTWCRGLEMWFTKDVGHPPSRCQGSRTLVRPLLPWETAVSRNVPRATEWVRNNMTLSWCSKFMPRNGCPRKVPRNVHRRWSNHTIRNSIRPTSSGLKKGLFASIFHILQRKTKLPKFPENTSRDISDSSDRKLQLVRLS